MQEVGPPGSVRTEDGALGSPRLGEQLSVQLRWGISTGSSMDSFPGGGEDSASKKMGMSFSYLCHSGSPPPQHVTHVDSPECGNCVSFQYGLFICLFAYTFPMFISFLSPHSTSSLCLTSSFRCGFWLWLEADKSACCCSQIRVHYNQPPATDFAVWNFWLFIKRVSRMQRCYR